MGCKSETTISFTVGVKKKKEAEETTQGIELHTRNCGSRTVKAPSLTEYYIYYMLRKLGTSNQSEKLSLINDIDLYSRCFFGRKGCFSLTGVQHSRVYTSTVRSTGTVSSFIFNIRHIHFAKLRSKTLPVGLNPRRLPHAAFVDHRRKETQEVTVSSACG